MIVDSGEDIRERTVKTPLITIKLLECDILFNIFDFVYCNILFPLQNNNRLQQSPDYEDRKIE